MVQTKTSWYLVMERAELSLDVAMEKRFEEINIIALLLIKCVYSEILYRPVYVNSDNLSFRQGYCKYGHRP